MKSSTNTHQKIVNFSKNNPISVVLWTPFLKRSAAVEQAARNKRLTGPVQKPERFEKTSFVHTSCNQECWDTSRRFLFATFSAFQPHKASTFLSPKKKLSIFRVFLSPCLVEIFRISRPFERLFPDAHANQGFHSKPSK